MFDAVLGDPSDDEKRVYAKLCEVIEHWIESFDSDGIPLPDPSTAKSSNFVPRVGPPIRHRLDAQALKLREEYIQQGHSMEDANLLTHMRSEEIANNGKVSVNTITMQTNLESGFVTYERLDKARWIITDGLNQLRKILKPTPAELELEQDAKRKYEKEKFIAEEKNQPAPKPPKELPKFPPQLDWMLAPLHIDIIPFEWAITPFAKNNSEKAETLVGWKGMTGLEKAILRVFLKNDARRILDALTLTTQEAALLFIDFLRHPDNQTTEPAPTSVADIPVTVPSLADVGVIIDAKLNEFLPKIQTVVSNQVQVDGNRTRQEIQQVSDKVKTAELEEQARRNSWQTDPLACGPDGLRDCMRTLISAGLKPHEAAALIEYSSGKTQAECAKYADMSDRNFKRKLTIARKTPYAPFFNRSRSERIAARRNLQLAAHFADLKSVVEGLKNNPDLLGKIVSGGVQEEKGTWKAPPEEYRYETSPPEQD